MNKNKVSVWYSLGVSKFASKLYNYTYTTAGGDGDLYRISAWLAHFFQVQWFVWIFVLASIYD